MTLDDRLATFPQDDAAFSAFVRETARTAGECSPDELQRLLRRWYPAVHVSAQHELAAFGRPIVYVFRDGRPTLPDGGAWWLADDAAHLEFDAEGTFRKVNDQTSRLVGMPASAMVGKRWSDLVDVEIADDDPEWLWQTLRANGYVHSIFRLVRPDGSRAWVEYRTEALGNNSFVSHWREVAFQESSPAGAASQRDLDANQG